MAEKTELGWIGASVGAAVLAGVAVAAVWALREYLYITSDAVILALLLLPVLIYLLLRREIAGVKGFGFEARLQEHVTDVGEDVTASLQIQPERAWYLGKLQQLLKKERQKKKEFCVIYADIDKLRETTRDIYLSEVSKDDRRDEKAVRQSVIRCLAFALNDAFLKQKVEGSKVDTFLLEEPDIAMTVRGMSLERTRGIAEAGLAEFPRIAKQKEGDYAYSVTIATLGTGAMKPSASAVDIDKELASRLQRFKDNKHTRGRVN